MKLVEDIRKLDELIDFYGHDEEIEDLRADTLESAALKIEALVAALKEVRKDICKCGVVVHRTDGCGTTFDYIGQEVGDPVTWEEWEAREA